MLFAGFVRAMINTQYNSLFLSRAVKTYASDIWRLESARYQHWLTYQGSLYTIQRKMFAAVHSCSVYKKIKKKHFPRQDNPSQQLSRLHLGFFVCYLRVLYCVFSYHCACYIRLCLLMITWQDKMDCFLIDLLIVSIPGFSLLLWGLGAAPKLSVWRASKHTKWQI